MVANAFDNRCCTRVTDCKSLTDDTREEGLSLGGSIEQRVSSDDILVSFVAGIVFRANNNPPTRHPLAEVIVGITVQLKGHARSEERTKALPSGSIEFDIDG